MITRIINYRNAMRHLTAKARRTLTQRFQANSHA